MLSSNHHYGDYKDPDSSDILDTSALIVKAIPPFQRCAVLIASHKNKDKNEKFAKTAVYCPVCNPCP